MSNRGHLHAIGAIVLVLASLGLAWYGQPDPATKWRFLAAELGDRLSERRVYIEPGELLELMHNDHIDLRVIDVRHERDWNLFHLWGAYHVPLRQIPGYGDRLRRLGDNGVIVLVGNDEAAATEGWKLVMASAAQPNAYILAGGINRWLADFVPGQQDRNGETRLEQESLRYPLRQALGSRHAAALPDAAHLRVLDFPRKVRLQKRMVIKGGCG